MGILNYFRRGKPSNASLSEKAMKEIREYYKACYHKAHDASRDRVLDNVRVSPGQDPYMVGHSALLQHHDSMVTSARDAPEKQTMAKYKITRSELQSIVK